MDLFEYQGKQFFASYDIPVSDGDVATTVDEAVAIAERVADYPVGWPRCRSAAGARPAASSSHSDTVLSFALPVLLRSTLVLLIRCPHKCASSVWNRVTGYGGFVRWLAKHVAVPCLGNAQAVAKRRADRLGQKPRIVSRLRSTTTSIVGDTDCNVLDSRVLGDARVRKLLAFGEVAA